MSTEEKDLGGRPTDYDEEFCEEARKLCLLGFTDIELAKHFGIGERTLNTWKKKHVKFRQSLNAGKYVADAKVAASLYHRALGYKKGNLELPPDPTSMIFWLKNRQSGKWRDKQEIEQNSKIEINIDTEDCDL